MGEWCFSGFNRIPSFCPVLFSLNRGRNTGKLSENTLKWLDLSVEILSGKYLYYENMFIIFRG